MERGLAIIEKTDTETKGFYIDQDVLEFARLYTRTKKRIADAEARTKKRIAHAEAVQRKAEQSRKKAEKDEAKRKAYNRNTTKHILIYSGIIGAVAWAGTAGMIHPVNCIPVSVFCLCAACLRLGAWLGKVTK